MKEVTTWSSTIITIFTRYLYTLTGGSKRWFCLHKERLCWMHERTERIVTVWEESTGHRQFFDLLLQNSRLCNFRMNEHTFYGFLGAIREVTNIKIVVSFSLFMIDNFKDTHTGRQRWDGNRCILLHFCNLASIYNVPFWCHFELVLQ